MKRIHFFIIPFMMDMTLSMAGLIANFRGQDLGATASQIGLIGSAWALPFAIFSPAAGKAAGHWNRRAILLAASALYVLNVLAYGLATHPLQLIMFAPLGGFASALFWPCFETLLHSPDANETHQRMGHFNVGWTLGLMCGSGAAGYFYRMAGPRWSFWGIAALILANGAYIGWLTRRGIPHVAHVEEGDEADHSAERLALPRRVGYLTIAWIANFCVCFGGAAASNLFPKLARTLQIADGPTGVLVAMITLAQSVSFYFLARSPKWHYRMGPLFAMQLLATVGLAGMVLGNAPVIFAVSFAMIGFGRGLTYSASLYYGLNSGKPHGVNTGIHEGIIGAAMVLGPFFGGLVAQRFSLRAPFELSMIALVVGVAIQGVLWRKLPNSPSIPGGTATLQESRK